MDAAVRGTEEKVGLQRGRPMRSPISNGSACWAMERSEYGWMQTSKELMYGIQVWNTGVWVLDVIH